MTGARFVSNASPRVKKVAYSAIEHPERGMEGATKMCQHSRPLRCLHNSASGCWAEEMYLIRCIT